MITCDEFCRLYWAHYISLERELFQTTTYVDISTDNYHTYSEAYLKLLLEIGSEIDVAQKLYCNLLDATFAGEKIDKYRACILANNSAFFTQETSVKDGLISIKPWENYDPSGNIVSPFWWTAYNKCKHERTIVGQIDGITKEYYKFANLKYTLNALAGLYQTLLYTYKIIASQEGKRIVVPLPGSRLFKLTGVDWESIQVMDDTAIYCDNGEFIIEKSGSIYY